jgi:hypothetical protein
MRSACPRKWRDGVAWDARAIDYRAGWASCSRDWHQSWQQDMVQFRIALPLGSRTRSLSTLSERSMVRLRSCTRS